MKNARRKSVGTKPAKGYKVVLLLPDSCICDSEPEKCVVVFNSSIPANVDYLVKFVSTQKSTFVRAERLNDFTLTFLSPATFPPGVANVSFYHGSNQHLLCSNTDTFTFKPKLEVVASLLLSVVNPISFISSAFKLNENDLVALDFMLERALKINCPDDFLKLKEHSSMQTNNAPGNSNLQCPTLLHFAAKYNFIKLCVALLQCPGSSTALDIPNDNGDTPIGIAENSGNKELAQIMSDAKNNNGVIKEYDADELYEQMSGEIYDRYKEMKDNFDEIYERMSQFNETYEPMFTYRTSSANSRNSVAADRHSVYSSDSAVSSGSTDSKGSLTATPPPVPPPSYNRSMKPNIGNPLINELRKKTQEKQFSHSFDSRESSPPPISPVDRQTERYSPRSKQHVRSCYEDVDMNEELENENELYDVPSNAKNNDMETYDVPPSRTAVSGITYNDDESELYDMPSNRTVAATETDGAEIYDFPTNRNQNTFSQEIVASTPPPISPRKISQPTFEGSEFYDCPSNIRSNHVPDHMSNTNESGNSSPEQKRLTPPNRLTPTKPFQIPGKIRGVSPSGLSRSLENLDIASDEVYDIVPPLARPSNKENPDWPPYDEPYQFNRKRFSEPTISTSYTEQLHTSSRSISTGNPPPLPPPNLPPRNVGKPQFSSPPPVPPPRRQQRPSC